LLSIHFIEKWDKYIFSSTHRMYVLDFGCSIYVQFSLMTSSIQAFILHFKNEYKSYLHLLIFTRTVSFQQMIFSINLFSIWGILMSSVSQKCSNCHLKDLSSVLVQIYCIYRPYRTRLFKWRQLKLYKNNFPNHLFCTPLLFPLVNK